MIEMIEFIPEHWLNLLEFVSSAIGIISALGFIRFLRPHWKAHRSVVILEKGLSADLYTPEIIKNAIRYYVPPDCQDQDPAGAEEPRLLYTVKQPIFKAMDDMLSKPSQYRYTFLLAGSGMGKTAFMINYYARHLHNRRTAFHIVLLPLGLPEVDERIESIKEPWHTVLFLDAFDEDTLAIVDHVARLKELVDLTRHFKQVVITCRTQFFLKDEEIPRETGILRIEPRTAGEGAQYLFRKLYLSPLSDSQVDRFLKGRYPFGRRNQRRKAREMVKEIPLLAIRPMLLTHVDDLIGSDMPVVNAFTLYQRMVDAWLIREEGRLDNVSRADLNAFSEQLACNLYNYRQQRGAERISREELLKMAADWNIPLGDWQLTGRSLLNRDALGNYKFAHRSIMEFLLVKCFMEKNSDCQWQRWNDQMQMFLWEVLQQYIQEDREILFDIQKADLSLYRIRPRSDPLTMLDTQSVRKMLKFHCFFDKDLNKDVSGIKHLYQVQILEAQTVIQDWCTGLMWQQSGSPEGMGYDQVKLYIETLNQEKFAGYADWRLPTLEEAMSLMEAFPRNGGLYLDSVFTCERRWIWTADSDPADRIWYVSFTYGGCGHMDTGFKYYVRAVRSV